MAIFYLGLREENSPFASLRVKRKLHAALLGLAGHSAGRADSRHGHVHVHARHVHTGHVHSGHVHVDGWRSRTHKTTHCIDGKITHRKMFSDHH